MDSRTPVPGCGTTKAWQCQRIDLGFGDVRCSVNGWHDAELIHQQLPWWKTGSCGLSQAHMGGLGQAPQPEGTPRPYPRQRQPMLQGQRQTRQSIRHAGIPGADTCQECQGSSRCYCVPNCAARPANAPSTSAPMPLGASSTIGGGTSASIV